MDLFLQQLANGVALGAVYAMFAIGFGLVFATMGILNVSHGTYATWGAIAALALLERDVPFVGALVGGVLAAGAIGVVVDRLAFEPLRRRGVGMLGSIITSIGAWIILGDLAQEATDAQARSFPSGSFPSGFVEVGGVRLGYPQLLNILVAAALVVGMHLVLTRTRLGGAIRAVGYDAAAASLSGVNPRLIIALTALLAGGVAGLAGVLSALSTNNVSFTMGEGLLLKGFAAVVVGGFGDVRGAALGGLIIGVSEVLGAQYISNDFRDAITFGLLVLFLVAMPRGIIGEREVRRA
ncbi:MAG TPA: branched-chain amino acid ABC transporter permease [Acidimicrobiales bacterium]|jgi:branched-chain amino acid transport system permease protein